MLKRTSLISVCIFMISILCFLGCGKKSENNPAQNFNEQQNIEYDESWKEEGFFLDDTVAIPVDKDNATLLEAGYVGRSAPEPDFVYDNAVNVWDYFSDKSYCVASYELAEGYEYWLYMRSYGEENYNNVLIQLSEDVVGSVVAMDVIAEDTIALLFAEGDDELIAHYVYWVDNTGKILNTVSLGTVYIDREGNMLPSVFTCDVERNSFFISDTRDWFVVFDEQGKLIAEKEYSDAENYSIHNSFHTPDGSVVFALIDWSTISTELLWFDVEAGMFKTLQILPHRAENFCMSQEGKINYIANFAAYEWDLMTGKHKLLFSFLESDISTDDLSAIRMKDEECFLYSNDKTGSDCYLLSNELIEKAGNITIANLAYGSGYVKGAAASFSRNHQNTQIVYEEAPGDGEAYRTQIMAEITSGKGPDMLWVSMEDMHILQEKGVLQDLTMIIPQKIREQIYPGIIQAGTVDGCYVGQGFEGFAWVLMTPDVVWEDEQWTSEQMLDLLEDNQQIKGLFADPNYYTGDSFLLNQKKMTLYLDNSSFLDLEAGKCDFINDDFIELLEVLKNYSGNKKFQESGIDRIKEGEFLAMQVGISDMGIFSQVMAQYDDFCHFVGYPNQTEGVGYWGHSEFLVINKQSEHMEEIKEFMEYLLSYELQRKASCNYVRQDCVRDSIVYLESSDAYMLKYEESSEGGGLGLVSRPDGNSYLEEYLEFLNNCEARPYYSDMIDTIVAEEMAGFAEGNRTARKTAEIIQNRVQLYLDEQK